jgi:ABC-type lipoprotein release transport system permease subunit
MVIVVQVLGLLGGLLVLIAGFVGAYPVLKLQIPPDAELSNAQITGALRFLIPFLRWSLVLFAVGGIFVLCAFAYYISLTGIS